ncbi:MAG: CPBP family intramembrane glutamic endopeptidase [Promethearchaeota archaeon]
MPKDRIKYCVHCGARIYGNQIYCPQCGKLVFKFEREQPDFKPQISSSTPKKVEISRKCSGCGSIITSAVLEQCPICNTLLEKIPEDELVSQKKTGFIFTEKKLEPEQKYEVKTDSWNLKEGFNVFANCLMVYIMIQLLVILLLWFQAGESEEIPFNIYTILIAQVPAAVFGLFPLWYIFSNNHQIEKLGFTKNSHKIFLAFIIGIAGGIGLLLINFFTTYVNLLLVNAGLESFDISDYIAEENQIIAEADFLWIILLLFLLCFASFSTELVFRGVLHNALMNKFDNSVVGRLSRIFIVSFVFSLIYLIVYFPAGMVFLLLNILMSIFLGLLYEINQNIYNTIIANIFYNILLIILLLL